MPSPHRLPDMATYSYSCPSCDEPVEMWHSIHECDVERFCPFHPAQVITRRIPGSVMFVLRGANHSDGWNGPTVVETQRLVESSERFKRGEIERVPERAILR